MMNPKDSNVYRKATGWLIYDSDGVARGDEHLIFYKYAILFGIGFTS